MSFRSERPLLGNQIRNGSKVQRPQATGEAPMLGNQIRTGTNNKGTGSLAGQPKAKLRRVNGTADNTAGARDPRQGKQ